MGGLGSGGRNRLSDAEKRRRGTFRADMSDAVYDEAAAAKVVAGPWLSEIPEPTLPLGEIGRAKYDEFTRELFEQHKLTRVTQMQAEVAAAQFEKIHALKAAGKHPSASDVTQLHRALDALKIAENAPPIAEPGGKRNTFATAGFSNRSDSAVRLRRAAPTRSGK